MIGDDGDPVAPQALKLPVPFFDVGVGREVFAVRLRTSEEKKSRVRHMLFATTDKMTTMMETVLTQSVQAAAEPQDMHPGPNK